MVQYVITPWRDGDELIKVRQAFYQPLSNDDDARRKAVALVSIWVQRGNCPHLIESTALLVSAQLNDTSGNSAYAVRAAYSASFCRFVTGLLDGYQDKKHKLSMYSIAKNIGLPATFVELRHQCTHEELPSLSKLRGAAARSLTWIWEQYWCSLEVKTQSLKKKTEEEGDISEDLSTILRKYMVWRASTESADESQRKSFAARLRKWDTLRILEVLEEFRDPMAMDSSMMLKSLRLTREILNVTADPEAFGTVDEEDADMESGKDNGASASQESAAAEPAETGPEKEIEDEQAGWTLWEGPWIPKPIGIV